MGIGLYIRGTYCAEYTKLRISGDLVAVDVNTLQFLWKNIEAAKWLYDNAKGVWQLHTDNWASPDYYILFADGKDAIMFKLMWL